jgi:hypothetical protein
LVIQPATTTATASVVAGILFVSTSGVLVVAVLVLVMLMLMMAC